MSAQDLFIEVGKPGSATTLDANYTAGDTSVAVVSTTNWPPVGKAVIFAIDNVKVVSGEEVQIQGTYNEFEGIVASATSISNVDQKLGSGDRDYAAGSLTRVYVPVSAERENRLAQGMAVAHNQDGALKDSIVATAKIADNAVTTAKMADASVTTAKMADASVTAEKLGTPVAFRATTTQTIAVSTVDVTTYTEVTDLGGNFNPATGLFTVPYSGIYQLNAQMRFSDQTGRLYLNLVASTTGTIVSNMFYNGAANGGITAVASITVALVASETVKVTLNNQTASADLNNSSFNGFLVGRTD